MAVVVPTNTTLLPPPNPIQIAVSGISSSTQTNWTIVGLNAATNQTVLPPAGMIAPLVSNQSPSFNQDIAYLNCDTDAYPGNIHLNDVLNTATSTNASIILFYSLSANACASVTGVDASNATNLYTTISPNDANSILMVSSGSQGVSSFVVANSSTYNAWLFNKYNGPPMTSAQTNVAMTILYTVTGIVTLMFLLVVFIGALKAHRHPQRYGTGQATARARARGIAQAVLDTIPVIKFGGQSSSSPSSNKEQDLEMHENGVHQQENETSTMTETDAAKNNHSTVEAKEVEQHIGASSTLVQSGSEDDNTVTCSICTEDFENGQDIRLLPCDHKFHPACVDPWLLRVSGTCPLCRVDLQQQTSNRSRNESSTSENTRIDADFPPPIELDIASQQAARLRQLFSRENLTSAARRLEVLRRFRREN